MIEDAMEHEDYNLKKWLKQYNWELVLSKDLKVYSQSALAYHFIFIMRRWILAAVIFACTEYGSMQLYAFLLTSMAQLIYVGWVRPFKSEGTNLLEMFNEFVVFNCALLLLTIEASRSVLNTMENPYYEGPVIRTIIGWFFLVLISLLVLVNAIAMAIQMVYDWKHSPLVKKRRAALSRYVYRVNNFEDNKCQCACASCSGNACKPNQMKAAMKFAIVLTECEVDTTMLIASAKKKATFTPVDKEDGEDKSLEIS